MKDLTKGKPSRLILAFALPIFLANLLQLTYSLVDTRIVGSFLGEDALAAVGATSSLSNLMRELFLQIVYGRSQSAFSAADFTLFKCTGKFKDNGGFLYCNYYCGIDCNISL